MNRTQLATRIYAAVAAVGVTLTWVLALGSLANHYAEAAATPGVALVCKPARASAG
ncbi:MAG: hypothetical protein HYX43_12850 [Burkholderiales bacterium]|nr:hypothetical protein [Burkholderiales bacterium]